MLLQILDQIILEVPEDKLFKVLLIIKDGMENFLPGFELYVPMKVRYQVWTVLGTDDRVDGRGRVANKYLTTSYLICYNKVKE